MSKLLEPLGRLQEVDLRIDRLRQFIDHYPELVKAMEEEHAEVKKRAEDEKAKLDELKKQKAKRELDLQQGEEHIVKCNARLYAVKTNKEYEATLKEIENQKKKNSEIETGILLTYDQIDQEEQRLQEARKRLNQEEGEAEQKKKALAQKLERARALLPTEEKSREQILLEAPKDFLENYRWIQERLGVKALTRVVDKICQSCFRVLPSQMYNETMVGNKMLTCPGCNRILIYREQEFLAEKDFDF